MLIPALLIVLLGEVGGAVVRGRYGPLALASYALVFTLSAGTGAWLAPMLTPPARTLLVGVALLFAAIGQLRAGSSIVPPALAIWSSSVPLSLFALSLHAASPFGPAIGGALGLAAAIGIGMRGATATIRRGAAAVLGVAGLIVALLGLRLL